MACGRSFPGSVEASRSGAKNVSRQSNRSSAGSSSRARHSAIRSRCSLAFFWEASGLLTQSVAVLYPPIRILAHGQIPRGMIGRGGKIIGAAKPDAGDVKGTGVELHTLVSSALEIADEPKDSDQAGPLPDKCVGPNLLHAGIPIQGLSLFR